MKSIWKKDKENNGTVKIISEAGEEIGELKISFKFQYPKKSRVKIPRNEHRES